MSKHLTIHELAEATGVTPATLRAWESRHGFPVPERSAGRHRRYTSDDANSVRAVVAERDAGSTLVAAIARAQTATTPWAPSLFAELGLARYPISPQVVSKRTMIALSHAIEDECSLAAEQGILVGAFQERRFYEAAESRWRVLARGATMAVVFADFPAAALTEQPARVPIAPRTPLEREWAIAHLARRTSVLLVGRERPGPAPSDLQRQFEVCWSAEPELVRELVGVAAHIADATAPAVGQQLRREADALLRPGGMDGRFVASLTTRMIGYLDR
jgi:DICT domain-containing protein